MSQEVAPSSTPEQINPPEKGEEQAYTTEPNAQPLQGEALEEAVRNQLEFLLSREHLATDYFLVSQMNAEMYVPLATLASICTLSTDVSFITHCMKKSTATTIDLSGTLIKPNFKISRTTLILRNIPSSVETEKVQEIFKSEECPVVVSLRPDVGDCWFATFGTEEDTLKALEFVRKRTFEGAPVRARIKSENLLRSFSAAPPTSETGMGMAGGYGFYPQVGYGYQRGGWNRPAQVNQSQVYPDDKDQRRAGGRGNGRQRKEFNNRKFPATSNNSTTTGNVTNDPRNAKRRAGRGGRKQSDSSKPSSTVSPTPPAQFQLGHAHFPPLGPSSTNPKSRSKSGYSKDFAKFSREELIGIVASTDVSKYKAPALPDSLPPSVILKEPSTELTIPRKPPTKKTPTETTEVHETERLADVSASNEVEHPVTAVSNPEPHSEAGSATSTEGAAPVPKPKKRRNSKKDTSHQGKGKGKPVSSRTQPGQTWAQVVVPASRSSAPRSPQASAGVTAPATSTPVTTTTTTPTALNSDAGQQHTAPASPAALNN